MASYTNDSLDKLCKQDLIPIVLSLQSKLDEANNEANNKVLQEVRYLSDTITKLSFELSITKNVNSGKLFINRSLCPYCKVLWSKSKKLQNLGKIHSFFLSGDTIKIKINENSPPLSVTHVGNFGNYFPDVDLSSPSR